MRRGHLVIVVAVIVASCANGSGSTATTIEMPTTSATGEPTTTSMAVTSTTAPVWPGVELLVTNDDGVFYIDSTGAITQLVKGRVAYAVDDTRGGLLFQVERGRSDRSSMSALADLDTTVWWVPLGAGEAQALIVPTPGTGQELTLSDAFADQDGRVQVVYVRSDTPPGYWDWFACTYHGDCPEVPTWYPGIREDLIDRLRIYDLDRQLVTEAGAIGVIESGISGISAGGGQLVALFINQVGEDCVLLNPSTAIEPSDGIQQGVWAELVWVPWIEAGCEGDGCPDICTLSPSGGLFGYTLAGQTLVVDAASGSERLAIDGLLIDLSDTHVLVDDGDSVVVFSIADPGTKDEVPVGGGVRFATSPVTIDSPVVSPTPAAIQLRADGLGIVDFGDPVDEVVAAIAGLFGPADSDHLLEPPWPEGGDCFQASGYGCEEYLRFVEWSPVSLRIVLSDWPSGVPALVGWSLGGLFDWSIQGGDVPFVTPEGIGIGSSLTELRRAYGDALSVAKGLCDEAGDWYFWVDESGLGGRLSVDPGDPDSRVVAMFAGNALGSC